MSISWTGAASRRQFLGTCAALAASTACRRVTSGTAVVPRPATVRGGSGRFVLDAATVLVSSSDPATGRVAARLNAQLEEWLGRPLQLQPELPPSSRDRAIVLTRDETARPAGNESYTLQVTPNRVELTAPAAAGLFYAAQTLVQLAALGRTRGGGSADVDCQAITDAPRFLWRGLMLDCSRTFQSLGYLRRTIDRMALYKLNTLHLHLTDDQGWRLEILKHPRLTQVGSRFAARFGEPEAYQGFYSQSEMRALIDYATERHVAIVPEIEMPGHSLAAVAVYPELSCSGGPFEIPPLHEKPKFPYDIFCAGNEQTFHFLEDVLAEVAALFPSPYLHIGGDETPKEGWLACPKCRRRMREEEIPDGEHLQSYFIHRIECFVHGQGKQLIGWDEILEGGLPPRATVMSWRGMEGGVAAASSGHDVVMCPTSHCYFDYDYERTPLDKVYAFEPVPKELTSTDRAHVLGAQANFWSHIDRPERRVDHQIYPRLLALAERVWSSAQARDYNDFATRARAHLRLLRDLGVDYAPVL